MAQSYIPTQAYMTVSACGTVGNDPEIRTFANDFKVCEISLAVSKSYKKKDGSWEEKTSWIYCKAVGYLAERLSQYVRKGMILSLTGELVIEKYANSAGAMVTKPIIELTKFSPLARVPRELSENNSNFSTNELDDDDVF